MPARRGPAPHCPKRRDPFTRSPVHPFTRSPRHRLLPSQPPFGPEPVPGGTREARRPILGPFSGHRFVLEQTVQARKEDEAHPDRSRAGAYGRALGGDRAGAGLHSAVHVAHAHQRLWRVRERPGRRGHRRHLAPPLARRRHRPARGLRGHQRGRADAGHRAAQPRSPGRRADRAGVHGRRAGAHRRRPAGGRTGGLRGGAGASGGQPSPSRPTSTPASPSSPRPAATTTTGWRTTTTTWTWTCAPTSVRTSTLRPTCRCASASTWPKGPAGAWGWPGAPDRPHPRKPIPCRVTGEARPPDSAGSPEERLFVVWLQASRVMVRRRCSAVVRRHS